MRSEEETVTVSRELMEMVNFQLGCFYDSLVCNGLLLAEEIACTLVQLRDALHHPDMR
jgi:hypothetical protein